jgi:hypothetical protein
MSLIRAYKIWEAKRKNSDFNRIKINSSGSFYMKSKDLFNDKEEVLNYVEVLNSSLKKRNENQKLREKSLA